MIPHKQKLEIIKRLVKADVLKGAPTIWGREVKLINELLVKYPDEAFWLGLGLGYELHSLAFFKMERGKTELETAWRYYKLTGGQQKSLDNTTKPETIELNNERIEQGSALSI